MWKTCKKEYAIFCENCGEKLRQRENIIYRNPNESNEIIYHKNKFAALIILIFPGFGQFYNGQTLKRLVFVGIFLLLSNLQSITSIPIYNYRYIKHDFSCFLYTIFIMHIEMLQLLIEIMETIFTMKI
ncbi:hypothetical protein ALNOE001_02600 [Candidatus Methanobinarius endosymbioticus]|uniref:TM2 domain-containing protein n=1 Tax=Candidatus Methanobinarius endosymbioticus TaxID=2006182 RepID=A0A366MDL2_9EURY|nr:hypothetical protein ALNOE001_02600 [Candidatus Methanobinarius endosymbioticus]